MAIFIFKDYSPPKEALDRQSKNFAPGKNNQQTSQEDYGRQSTNFKQTSYRINKPKAGETEEVKPVVAAQSGAVDLTPRQFDVFRHMLAFQDENGRPPTQMELSTRLGMKSEQGVKAHLAILEAKGYVVSGQKYGHRNKMAAWPGSQND
jgi:hypothetical protein